MHQCHLCYFWRRVKQILKGAIVYQRNIISDVVDRRTSFVLMNSPYNSKVDILVENTNGFDFCRPEFSRDRGTPRKILHQ